MSGNIRILIVRLSSIGDVLHCTPVPRALKKALPNCHITWIVGQVSSAMLRDNPYIDELHVWPREQWEQAMRSGKLREAWHLWDQLRHFFRTRRFAIALDIHGLFLSGMVTAASRAPRRIGLNGTKELNSLFMTETAPPVGVDELHVIQRYLSILRPLNIISHDYRMTLVIPPAAAQFAEEFFNRHRIGPEDKIIAINPVTTWPTKNWPAEYFAEVIRQVSRYAKILLCGGPGDRKITDEISGLAGVPVINAAGQTNLAELAALLARSTLLLTGDTGPLHMAIALGKPTVSIFGSTDPRRFGPLTPGHIVLTGNSACVPCHKTACRNKDLRCLKATAPATAADHILQVLSAQPPLLPIASDPCHDPSG